jgi:hypothetical protein
MEESDSVHERHDEMWVPSNVNIRAVKMSGWR